MPAPADSSEPCAGVVSGARAADVALAGRERGRESDAMARLQRTRHGRFLVNPTWTTATTATTMSARRQAVRGGGCHATSEEQTHVNASDMATADGARTRAEQNGPFGRELD